MRLVTRADFDGLVCGALVTKFENIEDYLFVEPKFLQDGLVEIRSGDIITNLPYHPNCTLWFDHHITNTTPDFPTPIVIGKGGFRLAPSAARVVYEYYTELGNRHEAQPKADQPTAEIGNRKMNGEEIISYLNTERMKYLLHETDRIDAGKLETEDVLNPQGYVLISMTTDGKHAGDRPYWLKVIDLRGIKEIPDGNRFLIFTLFPTGNIQVKVSEDPQRENTTAISVGYNIFNPTSKVNVGELLKNYGGGGHKVVGSSRVPNDKADQAIKEIVEAVTEKP